MLCMLKIPTKFGFALRKVFVKIKILFRIRIRIMILLWISYIEDTHQILFRSADSFESYCVHSQNPRTYSQTDRQIDRQTEIFFPLFCVLSHIKHEHSSRRQNFFLIMRLQYFLFLHTPYVMSK